MPDMIGCGTATTTNDVHKTLCGPVFNKMCCFFGQLIVFAHSIGQTRIGIGRGIAGCYLTQLLNMRAHFCGTQGAIKANAQWFGMEYRSIKGFQRLPTQRTARGISDGAADHNGQLGLLGVLEELFGSINGRLGIERIKNGFD